MKIVFMGTPDFAVPVLERLISDGYEIGYVLTQPDRAGNRGKVTFSPVKETALKNGIEVLQPLKLSKDEEVKEKIKAYKPDAIIVVAYGQILKQDILDTPRLGCFNVHGSVLPKLRGAAPIQEAIRIGLPETGVTVMKMGPGLDDGDMISVAKTPILKKNCEELYDELSAMGAELLSETLPKIIDGTAVYTKQNEEEATKCGIIKKDDGRFEFGEDPFVIERKIRAYDPWPGTFFVSGESKVKVPKAEPIDESCAAKPGVIVEIGKQDFTVSCGGKKLKILEIQVPGKKRMSAGDFMRGHRLEQGTDITELCR